MESMIWVDGLKRVLLIVTELVVGNLFQEDLNVSNL